MSSVAAANKKLKRKLDDEHRKFQDKWELQYFCIEGKNNLITCIICNSTISVCKEYNIKRHYDSKHACSYDKYTEKLRESKFEEMKRGLAKQQSVFTRVYTQSESAVKASYALSHLIASKSKPFLEGDFIKQCLVTAAEIMCPEKIKAFKDIALTRNTVAERIVDMAGDLREQLKKKFAELEYFSIAVDESTDTKDIAQLAVFIRACDVNLQVTEELLELVPLHDTTTSSVIFESIVKLLSDYNLPFEKLVCVATDGAPAMVGKNNGVAAKLLTKVKDTQPNSKFAGIHCIIHQQVLCTKILKFDNVLKPVTKMVNFIRARGLSHRQFTTFLDELGSAFEDLPYYTEVRWLSCHKVLKRFFELRQEIASFLDNKGQETTLFKDENWIQDLAFAVDMTGHLNDLNVKLQGRNQLVTTLFDNVRAFKTKLSLWLSQLKTENLSHFQTCQKVRDSFPHLTFGKYAIKIIELKSEFEERFSDFYRFEKEFALFISPFSYSAENADTNIQHELIELQCDSMLQSKYQEIGVPEFYKFLPSHQFPEIKKFVARIMAMFGSTYICEQLFSIMKINKSSHRSRLTDEHLSALMKVTAAQEITPEIDKLASLKRCQASSQRK